MPRLDPSRKGCLKSCEATPRPRSRSRHWLQAPRVCHPRVCHPLVRHWRSCRSPCCLLPALMPTELQPGATVTLANCPPPPATTSTPRTISGSWRGLGREEPRDSWPPVPLLSPETRHRRGRLEGAGSSPRPGSRPRGQPARAGSGHEQGLFRPAAPTCKVGGGAAGLWEGCTYRSASGVLGVPSGAWTTCLHLPFLPDLGMDAWSGAGLRLEIL